MMSMITLKEPKCPEMYRPTGFDMYFCKIREILCLIESGYTCAIYEEHLKEEICKE